MIMKVKLDAYPILKLFPEYSGMSHLRNAETWILVMPTLSVKLIIKFHEDLNARHRVKDPRTFMKMSCYHRPHLMFSI